MSSRTRSSKSKRARKAVGPSHAELCAAVRFCLDEPPNMTAAALAARNEEIRGVRAMIRRESVRATARMIPRVHRLTAEVAERLFLTVAPEVYVTAAPDFNAFALTGEGAPFCVLHHGLLGLLDDAELAAVLAHELGHAGLMHATPDGASYAAKVFGSQRGCAAEVSADRVAILALGSADPLLSSLVKLTCGLGATELRLDFAQIIEQFTHPDNPEEDLDGLDSHPELPFRAWAMRRFEATDWFHAVRGAAGGEPFLAVEAEIEDAFHGLDEGLAFRASSDLLHEAVAWVAAWLVTLDGKVSARERRVLSSVVGMIWADDTLAYARRNGLAALERRAKEALEPMRHAGRRLRDRLHGIVRHIAKQTRNLGRMRRARRLILEIVEPGEG